MASEQQIEESLIRGMKRIAVPYQKALEVLREHHAAQASGKPDLAPTSMMREDTDVCERLKPSMELIAECETIIQPLRQQWNGYGTTASDDLKQLVDEQTVVLEELISLLNSLEGRMAASRNRMGAHLDVSQRQTAMRRAYQ